MKVTTGGVGGFSLFVRLQLTEGRSKTSNNTEKLCLLARACTMLNMASLRSALERGPLYSSRARRELTDHRSRWSAAGREALTALFFRTAQP